MLIEKFLRWLVNCKIVSLLPQNIRDWLRPLWLLAARWTLRGNQVFCPVCERPSRDFVLWRKSRICALCGSLERQRAIACWLRERSQNFNSKCRLLHVAPDYCLIKKLRKHVTKYVSVDLYDRKAMFRCSLTSLPFEGEAFDLIICSHVLEHINEDTLALRELNRVLAIDGELLVLVPIRNGTTYEDATITSPKDRQIHFGQSDHVRYYGMDIVTRLENAGLSVSSFSAPNLASDLNASNKMGLLESDILFVCKKLLISHSCTL